MAEFIVVEQPPAVSLTIEQFITAYKGALLHFRDKKITKDNELLNATLSDDATVEDYRDKIMYYCEAISMHVTSFCVIREMLANALLQHEKKNPLPENYPGLGKERILDSLKQSRETTDRYKRDLNDYINLSKDQDLTKEQLAAILRLVAIDWFDIKDTLTMDCLTGFALEVVDRKTLMPRVVHNARTTHTKIDRSKSIIHAVRPRLNELRNDAKSHKKTTPKAKPTEDYIEY